MVISDQENNLKNVIIEKIKEIILNEKRPGDKLWTERKMAEEFGVSRSVIRDAIKTLSGLGLLEVRHREGIFVANVNSETIAKQLSNVLLVNEHTAKNLFQTRLLLETATAGWAAESCDINVVNELSDLIDKSYNHINMSVNNLTEFGVIDRKFHLTIAEMSQNTIVIEFMKNLLVYLEAFSKHTFTIPGRISDSVKEHENIFKAIKNRDRDGASKAMHDHISSVYYSILNEIIKKNSLF